MRDDGLHRTNQLQVMLMQALIGVISSNFRMVSLDVRDGVCKIITVLNHHDAEDEEEAADLAGELSILSDMPCESEIIISNADILLPPPPVRIVFRRKES